MKTQLSIQERLKDLRVEKGITLEQLSQQTEILVKLLALMNLMIIRRCPMPFFLGIFHCPGNIRTLPVELHRNLYIFCTVSCVLQNLLRNLCTSGSCLLVISPATNRFPFVAITSQATLELPSSFKHSSSILSAIRSHSLSGWPSVTDSAV